MKSFSLMTDPELFLYYLKYGKNDIVYIDSLPYEGVDLYAKGRTNKIEKVKTRILKAKNKRNFR